MQYSNTLCQSRVATPMWNLAGGCVACCGPFNVLCSCKGSKRSVSISAVMMIIRTYSIFGQRSRKEDSLWRLMRVQRTGHGHFVTTRTPGSR